MNIAAEIAIAVIATWLVANGVVFLLLFWNAYKQRG